MSDGLPCDVILVVLCDKLTGVQAEWQRLHAATSDDDALTTVANHTGKTYSNSTSPAIMMVMWDDRDPNPMMCVRLYAAYAPPREQGA